jgi:hypothetical protein
MTKAELQARALELGISEEAIEGATNAQLKELIEATEAQQEVEETVEEEVVEETALETVVEEPEVIQGKRNIPVMNRTVKMDGRYYKLGQEVANPSIASKLVSLGYAN